MWTGLYPDKPEDPVPIGHITNGVHVPTWLAPQMFRLYDRHFGPGWHEHSSDARIWEGIEKVDDGELWETHLSLKSQLLDFVRVRAIEQARHRGEPPESVRRVLTPDALTIGFARRFATYKRANLILADFERLASMVNDPKRPVQFIFAGKAHQRDQDGIPRGWIKRMKRTIRTLGWRFNADRMVMDYTLHCYVPAAGGTSCSH